MLPRWYARVVALLLLSAVSGPATAGGKPTPVTGKAGPGLEALDKAVLLMLERHAVPGAALAIARDGKLVYAKGFGWADTDGKRPATPTTKFGLASLSKPLTATAILRLVEDGKLSLDDRVFDRLAHIKPPPDARIADPRIKQITVRQLLNHSGGWNRTITGDPGNWAQRISDALEVPLPIKPEQLAAYALTQPLDFAPGTESQYSNLGYTLLGLLIEKASGETYSDFVRKEVLKPAGAEGLVLHAFDGKYLTSEARRYLVGIPQPLPALRQPMNDSAGGWSGSTVDLVRFLTALDGTRGKPLLQQKTMALMIGPPPAAIKRFPDGSWVGLGWDQVQIKDREVGYFKNGQYHGVSAYMKRLPSGVNWVLLFNASMQPDMLDNRAAAQAVQEVHGLLNRTDYPKIDLFAEFR